MHNARPIILYDGDCGLCDRLVKLLKRIDRKGKLCRVALSSTKGQAIVQQHHVPVGEVDSIWMITNDRYCAKSDAVIEAARIIGGAYGLFVLLKIIPRSLRDFSYDKIAANRYHWFGRSDACSKERSLTE